MNTYNEIKTAIQEMGKNVKAAEICEIIWDNNSFTISEKLELIETLASKIEK